MPISLLLLIQFTIRIQDKHRNITPHNKKQTKETEYDNAIILKTQNHFVEKREHICCGLFYPWFKLYFPFFKSHYHTQKQRKTKLFKPRIKLNHNIYPHLLKSAVMPTIWGRGTQKLTTANCLQTNITDLANKKKVRNSNECWPTLIRICKVQLNISKQAPHNSS